MSARLVVERPEHRSPKHVGSTQVGGVWVSTTHTADHGWETMVFPCDPQGTVTDWSERDCDRYENKDGAIQGHTAMVEKWTREERAS